MNNNTFTITEASGLDIIGNDNLLYINGGSQAEGWIGIGVGIVGYMGTVPYAGTTAGAYMCLAAGMGCIAALVISLTKK